tara:strand:- start:1765 stop:2331 length:567 start_codon:yes stop_codon:yes gene_type:complete
MQREMIHTDAFLGMMPVRDHREFKIKVHNAIAKLEKELKLRSPEEEKELSGDKDLSAQSVLNVISGLGVKVEDDMKETKLGYEQKTLDMKIAFANATLELHDQWMKSKTPINPDPRGEYNPYLIGSTPTGLTPNQQVKGRKTRIADHKEFVDPKTIKARNKKEMLERWEAMKKELEAEGYTNIHSQFH